MISLTADEANIIADLKEHLKEYEWTGTFRNRGGKHYLTVKYNDTGAAWNAASNIVRDYFPKASCTSGGAYTSATYRLNP